MHVLSARVEAADMRRRPSSEHSVNTQASRMTGQIRLSQGMQAARLRRENEERCVLIEIKDVSEAQHNKFDEYQAGPELNRPGTSMAYVHSSLTLPPR